MHSQNSLVEYYRARAAEYEKVYAKPERQTDLRALYDLVPAYFAGRRVLEIACGSGYWTRVLGARAASIVALDLAPEMLAIARAQQSTSGAAQFSIGDAFDLAAVPGVVDAAFAGFWWSHVPREDLPRFLSGLNQRLPANSPVLLLDNRYVEGSNWPITRTDTAGNTYQRRRLENQTEHEVLKNFPTRLEVRRAIEASGGSSPTITDLAYYWYASYLTPSSG